MTEAKQNNYNILLHLMICCSSVTYLRRLQGPTRISDDVVARRTRATKPLSWRRSLSSIDTWRDVAVSNCHTCCVWRSDRSRSGSRTGAWRRRKKSKRLRNWTIRRSRKGRQPQWCRRQNDHVEETEGESAVCNTNKNRSKCSWTYSHDIYTTTA